MVPWCRVSERAPDAIVVLNFVLRFLFLITLRDAGLRLLITYIRAGYVRVDKILVQLLKKMLLDTPLLMSRQDMSKENGAPWSIFVCVPFVHARWLYDAMTAVRLSRRKVHSVHRESQR